MRLLLTCILLAAGAAALPTLSPSENDQAEEREVESQSNTSTIRWLQKSVTELLRASQDLQQQNQQLRTEVAQHNVRLSLCEAATFPSGSRGPTAGGNLNTSAASNFSVGWRNLQSSGPASQGEYVRILKRKISVDPSSSGLNGGHRRFMQAQAMQQFMVCRRPTPSVPGTLGCWGRYSVQRLTNLRWPQVVCPAGVVAEDCIPACTAELNGDVLLLNIYGSDSRLTCELHRGLYSWVGGAGDGGFYSGDAHIGGDGVAFLAAVLSSAAGFYMLTASTLALSHSLETSFGQRVSVVGIGLAPIPCACFLYMRLSVVL